MPFLGGSCRVAVSMSSKGMLLVFRRYTEGTLVAITLRSYMTTMLTQKVHSARFGMGHTYKSCTAQITVDTKSLHDL